MNDDHKRVADGDAAAATGAYALHALDAADAARVEQAMAHSEELAAEVIGLADTAVELGLALPEEEPPAALRASILDRIATTPQLAPLHETSTDAPVAAGTVPDAPAAVQDAPVAPLAEPAATHAPRRAPRRRASQPRDGRRPRRLAFVAGALAVVALIAGGVTVGVTALAPSGVHAVEAASDGRHATMRVEGGGTMTIAWSDDQRRAAVTAADLPALSAGKTYQLWYIDGTTARSAGLYSGRGATLLAGSMHPGDVIGLTVEPAGGSAEPTTDPVVTLRT